jgi:NAD(P)H-hydrate epimerase
MKIVKAQEMARIERLAYAQGASEEQFMNSAGRGVAELVRHILAVHHLRPHITLLCGSGNNAGDAYVAGRLLLEGGFHVNALALAPFEKSSQLCQLQSKRFKDAGGNIHYVEEGANLPLTHTEIMIDGILGTGFHGEVRGSFRLAIEQANASKIPIIAVDIPSGINGTTGEIGGCAIYAFATLFLGLPKSGCFFKEAWEHVGEVHVYDFGLGEPFISQANEDYQLIDGKMITLPHMARTRHKYQAGYVVGLGGCPGMPGAPIMASFAALRVGAGIVRLLHREGMEGELSAAPPEVIKQSYNDGKTVLIAMQRASAVFVGPGIGTSSKTLEILTEVLPNIEKPCVIDAEALTLLAEHEIKLPRQTIMTPHIGELKRLLHQHEDLPFKDLIEKSQAFATQKNVILILKGAPTFIFSPTSKPFVCMRGSPGMATAGSGDVLTGMIAGLLAQVHDPLQAAILGVELHAAAGEHAAKKWTPYCMVATDITAALPDAFREYQLC